MTSAKAARGTGEGLGEALVLFERWIELPESEQPAELDRIRIADPNLHEKLTALIRADADADARHFLDRSAIADAMNIDPGVVDPATLAAGPGRIGPWTLERSLGSGGMGRVWLARRHDGLFEGSVAIKMLRESSADEFAVQRFAREGQILARLAHANIARLLDAGTLADGQRYLVIEYVKGERIDSFCDARRLEVAARVRLFLQVCEAVVHAHSNLVVHRDLKPANILVMADGRVKLLDFGVAKLIEEKTAAGEESPLTHIAGAGLTPEYAAPEQVEGGLITTATDVYSLGMVLYRLLSGSRPYGSDASSPARLARDIVDTEARPLSASFGERTVVSNTRERAEKRATSPERLRRILRGDLENILAKALRKKPAERYASVRALMDDLESYLANKPVSARPDRINYRLGKFVRRHWIGVAATTAVVSAILAGVVGVVWQARIAIAQKAEAERQASIAHEQELLASREGTKAKAEAARASAEESNAKEQRMVAERYRGEAQQEALRAREQELAARQQSQLAKAESEKAKAVRDFMVDIFRTNLPAAGDIEKAQQLTARELLENGSRRIAVKFAREPEIRADLLDIVGELFYRLGDSAKATELARERVSVLEGSVGERSKRTRDAYKNLSYALQADGNNIGAQEAISHLGDLLDAAGERTEGERAWVLIGLARTLLPGNPAEAERKAREGIVTLGDIDHLSASVGMRRLALLTLVRAQILLEQFDQAATSARAALELIRRVSSGESSQVGIALGLIGEVERSAQEFNNAADSLRQAYAITTRTLGKTNPDTIAIQAQYGALLHQGPRRAEGLAMLADAVRVAARVPGAKGVEAMRMRLNLGHAYFDEGRFEEAEAVVDAAIDELRQRPEYHLLLARTLIDKSRLLVARGQADAGLATADEATALLAKTSGGKLPLIIQSYNAATEATLAGDRLGEAGAILERARMIPEAPGMRFPTNRMTSDVVAAEHLLRRGEPETARDQLHIVVARIESDDQKAYYASLLSRALFGLGRAQLVNGELIAARDSLRRSVVLRRALGPLDSPWLAEAQVALADCLISLGERDEARRLLIEADAAFAKHLPLGRQFLYPLEKVRQRL